MQTSILLHISRICAKFQVGGTFIIIFPVVAHAFPGQTHFSKLYHIAVTPLLNEGFFEGVINNLS